MKRKIDLCRRCKHMLYFHATIGGVGLASLFCLLPGHQDINGTTTKKEWQKLDITSDTCPLYLEHVVNKRASKKRC
jgi:hypothetical protein